MMDWTDRHCRAFHRVLAPGALLYTEMVHAQAVIHGDRERLLGFDASEHPVALQLGGSDPALLAQAARIGVDWGYDQVNLNVGCPSDRVQAGRFGACLMKEPPLVSKADLTEHIYQQDFDRDSNVLEVFIGRLRKKLDPEGELKPIETVRGRGYRFAIPRSGD